MDTDGDSHDFGTFARERDRLHQQLLEARGGRRQRRSGAALSLARSGYCTNGVLGHGTCVATGPAPVDRPGRSVTEYYTRMLVALVRQVHGADVLRTRDEKLATVMREFGIERGGAEIIAATKAAQAWA